MKILTTILAPSSGRAFVSGLDVRLFPPDLPDLTLRPAGLHHRGLVEDSSAREPDDLRFRCDAFPANRRLVGSPDSSRTVRDDGLRHTHGLPCPGSFGSSASTRKQLFAEHPDTQEGKSSFEGRLGFRYVQAAQCRSRRRPWRGVRHIDPAFTRSTVECHYGVGATVSISAGAGSAGESVKAGGPVICSFGTDASHNNT